MSAADIHIKEHVGHDTHADHDLDHEHHDSFITKYIFSIDHKMIAKQYLLSGIFWAIIGIGLSMIFRIQLGFQDVKFDWLKPILGKWVNESGRLDPEFY